MSWKNRLRSLLKLGLDLSSPYNSRARPFYPIEYWENRAAQHGKRSVLNLSHTEAEMEAVTRMQEKTLFPLLEKSLRGDERMVLDFGCGWGRFTPSLATLIAGEAIGVDPIRGLIDLAPRHPKVQYRLMKEAVIPFSNETFDVVWVCLVLGGITQEKVLRETARELERVTKQNGLLFLVENTEEREDIPHWKFRPVDTYVQLFPQIELTHALDYIDAGERISVLVGRKK